jgi:hypothetical protein
MQEHKLTPMQWPPTSPDWKLGKFHVVDAAVRVRLGMKADSSFIKATPGLMRSGE